VDQKMNVVRGDHIVEHGQTEAFFCLENPVQTTAPIAHFRERWILSVSLLNGLNGAKALERLERFEQILC